MIAWPKTMSVCQTAEVLQVTPETIRRWFRASRLPGAYKRPNGRWLIDSFVLKSEINKLWIGSEVAIQNHTTLPDRELRTLIEFSAAGSRSVVVWPQPSESTTLGLYFDCNSCDVIQIFIPTDGVYPIHAAYVPLHSWQELVVFVTAHEDYHAQQSARGDRSWIQEIRPSFAVYMAREVECNQYAKGVLKRWRELQSVSSNN